LAQSRAKDIEEKEEAGRHKKAPQPVYDQLKVPDEGVADFQVGSSFDTHAALLGGANTDAQRSDLAMHLQKTYGNRYVQRLVESTRVEAKLIVNSPDDEYEREADRVADAVTRTPASSVQRQVEPEEEEEEEEEEPIQTKMSRIQRQPATETKAEAPKAEAGIDKSRVAALKVMFEAAVVGPCRTAYKALKQEKPDPSSAYENVHNAVDVIRGMMTSYKGVEPMYSRLVATANVLLGVTNALRPHIGDRRPLTEISDDLNPDGKIMPRYFRAVRSKF
jgi:hypothetical protein